MKTYKQYYKEQGPAVRSDSGRFQKKKYDKAAASLVKDVEDILKGMEDRSPEDIRQDIYKLLLQVDLLYAAGEGERTPSLGNLARMRTQIKKRGKAIPGTLPSFAEARQFLLDIKVIINEGSTDI